MKMYIIDIMSIIENKNFSIQTLIGPKIWALNGGKMKKMKKNPQRKKIKVSYSSSHMYS